MENANIIIKYILCNIIILTIPKRFALFTKTSRNERVWRPLSSGIQCNWRHFIVYYVVYSYSRNTPQGHNDPWENLQKFFINIVYSPKKKILSIYYQNILLLLLFASRDKAPPYQRKYIFRTTALMSTRNGPINYYSDFFFIIII